MITEFFIIPGSGLVVVFLVCLFAFRASFWQSLAMVGVVLISYTFARIFGYLLKSAPMGSFITLGFLLMVYLVPMLVFYNSRYREAVALKNTTYIILTICTIFHLLISSPLFYFLFVVEVWGLSAVSIPQIFSSFLDNNWGKYVILIHFVLFSPTVWLFCLFCHLVILSLSKKQKNDAVEEENK
jgi:hypothetical protein